MIGARGEAKLALVVFLATSAFFQCVQPMLQATVTIARPQKYFRSGETIRDFLRCKGGHTDSTVGIRVTMGVARKSNPKQYVPITANGDQSHYTFVCTPEMPVNGGCAPSGSASCSFGVIGASAIKDAGWYHCQVDSCVSSIHSATMSLAINVYDYFILGAAVLTPARGTINKGQAFFLTCPVHLQTDISTLTIQCRQNGHAVSHQAANLTDPFVHSIGHARPANAGTYKCVIVSSDDGSSIIDTTSAHTVKVKFAPVTKIFSTLHPASSVPYHKTNHIVCSAKAYPELTQYHMELNGTNLPDIKVKTKGIVTTLTKTIYKTASEDDGKYCCVFINEMKSTRRCLTVVVLTPAKITSLRALETEQRCLPDRKYATLECRASGTPTPAVSIVSPKGIVVGRSDPLSSGVAKYVFRTHLAEEGMYQCRAKNWAEDVKDFTLCLEILITFQKSEVPPNQSSSSGHCFAAGSEGNLSCAAAGRPPLAVTIRNSNGMIVASDFIAAFALVSTSDTYSCTAENNYSKAHQNLDVCFTNSHDQVPLILEYAFGSVAGLILISILLIGIHCLAKNIRRAKSFEIYDEEKDPLVATESQIQTVAELIIFVWLDIFRSIEPSFKRGDDFLNHVYGKEGKDAGRSSAVQCMRQWMNENHGKDVIKAVRNAALSLHRRDIAEDLEKEFPHLNRQRAACRNRKSFEMSYPPFPLRYKNRLSDNEKHVDFVSKLIPRVWKEFCGVICPPFRGDWIEYIEKRAKLLGSQGEEYWIRICLRKWINENQTKNFVSAVYNALKGMDDQTLTEKFCKQYSNFKPGTCDTRELISSL